MDASKSRLGKKFEAMVEAQMRQYEVERRFYWQRNWPPTRYTKIDGRLAAIPSGEGPPDVLTLARDRTGEPFTVLFEIKSFDGTRWQLANVQTHQAAALDKAEAAGATSGVLLGQFDKGEFVAAFWLPWSVVGTLWHRWHLGVGGRGTAGLNIDELPPWKLVGVDWIEKC